MSNYITGATTALITPFKNGTLDEATFAILSKDRLHMGSMRYALWELQVRVLR